METWNEDWTGWALPGPGYSIGSLATEVTKPRGRLGDSAGTAVLSRRRLRDYLDDGAPRALGGFAVVAVLAVIARLVAPSGGPADGGHFSLTAAMAPLGVATLAIVLAMWTCRRRELAGDDAALAYEELTRAGTSNAFVGVAVAMLGAFAAELGSTTVWWVQLAVVFASYAGLGYWFASGTGLVFRTRRIDALRAEAMRAPA